MSGWAVVFLGVIAVTSLATAAVQIGLLVAAGLLARRLVRFVDRVEQDLRPAVDHLNAIARDASRAASLATAQVERADQLVRDITDRLEQFVAGFRVFSGGAIGGSAFFSAFKAFVEAFRERAPRSRRRGSRADDEDALFI